MKINYGYDSIQLNTKIFLIGGCPSLEIYSDECYEYSFLFNKIQKITSLNTKKRDHTLGLLNNKLY